MIITLNSNSREDLTKYVSNSIIKRIDENRNFFIPLGEKKYLIAFHWTDNEKVIIFACKEDFIICTDNHEVLSFVKAIDVKEDGILQLQEFFLELTAGDIYKLESLENMIIELEDNLFSQRKPSPNGMADIIKLKKRLLKVKRYYEQMEFMTDEIAAIDPTFTFIDKKFDRLLDFILHLQEYIEQVREAYQSQIDIEQNNIMKVFTVVTSIFLPLTLITGWYGMNLKMPEFLWPFGYPIVIGISLIVVLTLIAIFKKKKWF